MANATPEVQSSNAAGEAGVAKVDMKFEIVVIPVSDIDRAKEFYATYNIDGGQQLVAG
ncbi:VOC family protein [Paracidobacterium acidisoli]|uniref:VOC family protein n=1 Tax=Paracidobacterium acidisoli TaxID=2303751 RepID=UPI0018F1BDBB|nr:hypothetical protein [Paracidobacterium acidisoli]MBT9330042.1 hypothetical protein [Paracidobacterium acidisoli]